MSSNINGIAADLAASLAGLGAGIIIFIFLLLFGIIIMSILDYIFSSLAFYRFMNNRNLDNAFLAWIPIAREYAIGKVYDDINEKQGKKNDFDFSIILLILSCCGLNFVASILKLICYHLIFKKYTPNNSNYFVITVIFTIIPIVPFIPGLCL